MVEKEIKKRKRKIISFISIIISTFEMGYTVNADAGFYIFDVFVGNFINIMCIIFRWVGIAMFAWGVIQFILSSKKTIQNQNLKLL